MGETALHSRTVVRWIAAGALLLCACGAEKTAELAPKLAVRGGTAVDASARADYLIDFGDVDVGVQSEKFLFIENMGRAPLVLQPALAHIPFLGEVEAIQQVAPLGSFNVGFVFAPSEEGPATSVVHITSNGGTASVLLTGHGVVRHVDDCVFRVSPTTVACGNVAKGASITATVEVQNIGSAPCALSGGALATETDPAFTSDIDQLAAGGIAVRGQSSLNVTFSPTHTGRAFMGALTFHIAPGSTVIRVPLTGSSIENCELPLDDGSCPITTDPTYVTTTTALYTYDLNEGSATLIGAYHNQFSDVFRMVDIAIDGDGVLFGVSEATTPARLYNINPLTGACQFVAHLPEGVAGRGLAFLPDGRLVAAGNALYVIDRRSAEILETLVPPGNHETSGDIVALPDGMIYWSVATSSASRGDQLVRVDPRTGEVTELGLLPFTAVYGLAYQAPYFFGFTTGGASFVIDPGNASGRGTVQMTGPWWGAASNPTHW